MKINPKRIVSFYFNKWWVPSATTAVLLLFFVIIDLSTSFLPKSRLLVHLAYIMFVLFGLSPLGILAASICNFIRKHWARGIINLFMLPVFLVIALFTFGFLMFASMFGPSEDGFADNLKVPQNISISEPQDELEASLGGPEDAFQARMLAALESPGNTDCSVTATLTSLVKLQKNASNILMRYLATSPSWRVFKERQAVFATRRWMVGSKWRYDLHGYYTRHDLDMWSTADIPDFQSRFTIGFSGKPWARVSSDSTQLQEGQTVTAKLSVGNQMHESHCVITAESLIVELFEQSSAKERRLTKAALVYLEEELCVLAATPKWETIKQLIPLGSIRSGKPSFELRKSFQPGIYDSEIWVNPGEPGMIYLKAFEVTHGTPLSVDRLKKRSNEWVGWSIDPSELFFSNTNFTIYEGDWGKPYAARFEVWFVPDSKNTERKLIEKIFKIEGWQR